MKNRLFTIILMLFLSVGILSAAALAAPTAGGKGLSPDDPMVVPADAMVINNNTYYGVSKTWFASVNPDKGTLYVALQIPDTVTTIANDAFRDNYTSDKAKYGAVTTNNGLGQCTVAAIDFSQATALTTIRYQAAMRCSYLSGVLDLSHTKITTLGKSAFSGCTGLTGVILPDTLEVLGEADGSAGSVFNGCTGLQFVRTARSDKDAVFELPSGLIKIGNQTFQDTFPKGANLKIQIPASVETIGSQAFSSNSAFSQIYINRKSGFSGYNKDAFKANSSADCLVIFSDALAYMDFGNKPPTRATRTFPVRLDFTENGKVVWTDYKLFGQSIQYTRNQNGIWEIDDDYVLPPISDSSTVPGYDSGWRLREGKEILTNTSKVSGTASVDKESGQGYIVVTVENNTVVSKPTVKYSVNGSVVPDAGVGVPQLKVAVAPGSPGRVGVQVTHPLATEEARKSGTYVYFEYCWWDEMDNGVNGPRSVEEPELFSTSITSSSYKRVFTGNNEIPIRSSDDARTDGDYYMVEIFGYYVENNGPRKQYYKSSHNFIAGDTATDARSYVMNVIATDAVTVAIVPADITVYVGGNGYEGAVDGSGALLGEDNGFPVPGFTISAEGLDNFDPTKAVLTYENDNVSRSWYIVPYDGEIGDGMTSHGIYRFEPYEGSNTAVRMQFEKTVNGIGTGEIVTDDNFVIEDNLGQDLLMEVYGESIEMGYVKLVYDGVEYAVTTDNGTLKVRSTTDSPEYGEVVAQEASVPNGESGVVAPVGTTYYINNKPVEVVDASGVKLLFDDIVEDNSADVTNTQLLINRADSELGGASSTRRYEAKYLDLVDTNNGNAWVAADENITVYWPLPAGTGRNTSFTLLHFEGLHREMGVDVIESGINSCDVTPVTVENTGTHVKFTVSRAGFSPFILVWDEYNTPITPIPEPDNSPVGLNTEDHVAYIIGYEDGTVRPGAHITRAEVATIFFRLLTDETRESYWSQSSGFTDVASGAWYNNAVSTLTRAGILDGYEDGSFRPNASITRAEFTKIPVSFFKHVGGASSNPFNDVPDSAWYAEFVKAAAELGLIDGYEDGTFRPNAPITRAEACTIVNRTLGRAPDKDNLLPEHEMLTWPDNSRDAWYYAQIQEATNSHDYQWLGAIELWTAKLAERDWDALEKEWSNAYSAPGGEVAR